MRFRYLRDPLFLICVAGYCLNRWVLKPLTQSVFLHSWFNDLLLAPCALPIVLWLWRCLNLRNHDRPPTATEIVWVIALWSVLFEAAGPLLLASATGDWTDVLMYFAGAALSLAGWNLPHELR